MHRADRVHNRFINMPKGKMIKQVLEGENIEFLFEDVGTQGTNTFQVFNGAR